jgi:cell wall-associated NlpC family hydrolase
MRFSTLLFGVSLACAVAAIPAASIADVTDVVERQEGDGALDEAYVYEERQEGDDALDEEYSYDDEDGVAARNFDDEDDVLDFDEADSVEKRQEGDGALDEEYSYDDVEERSLNGTDNLVARATRGQLVVNAAKTQKGVPYVFGGGGCKGKSHGGFDCSGLTQFAHCKALKKTIPRTAATQYSSKLGKRIARSKAQAGDLLFWAQGGRCSGSNVSHVGIFMSKGKMINAAHSGTPVREQAIWTSSGGLKICPYVMRFW